MRRALQVMLAALVALVAIVPLRDLGDRAGAQTPPPIAPVPPVVAPGPTATPANVPTTAPTAPTATSEPGGTTQAPAIAFEALPVDACNAILEQALAELDFWRTQGLPLAAAPPGPSSGVYLGLPRDRPRVAQVASALKEMKPEEAALVVLDWDDGLATEVLARLPARASGAICAALPPAHAARLLARLSLLAVTEEAP